MKLIVDISEDWYEFIKEDVKQGSDYEPCVVIVKGTPLTECEDVISREATVKRLCKVAEYMNEKRDGLGSPYVMAALFIQDNKDEFPSVHPKAKTGKWIDKGDGFTDHYGPLFCCSQCGNMSIGKQNFCKDCGADMRGKE